MAQPKTCSMERKASRREESMSNLRPYNGESIMAKDMSKEMRAMTPENRFKRLDEIVDEVFAMANAFALEDAPGVGCQLHESVNRIWAAKKAFESGDGKIPIEFALRSMGLGMGTCLTDLLLKYADDLENESNED